MKQIGISDATYQAIAAQTTDVSAFVEQAVERQLAKQVAGFQHKSEEDLVERFRQYRGMLQEVTIEDIVESRHIGLL